MATLGVAAPGSDDTLFKGLDAKAGSFDNVNVPLLGESL